MLLGVAVSSSSPSAARPPSRRFPRNPAPMTWFYGGSRIASRPWRACRCGRWFHGGAAVKRPGGVCGAGIHERFRWSSSAGRQPREAAATSLWSREEGQPQAIAAAAAAVFHAGGILAHERNGCRARRPAARFERRCRRLAAPRRSGRRPRRHPRCRATRRHRRARGWPRSWRRAPCLRHVAQHIARNVAQHLALRVAQRVARCSPPPRRGRVAPQTTSSPEYEPPRRPR